MSPTIKCGLAVLLLVLVGVQAECPDGFERHGASCYTLPHVKADWGQATVVCGELNAHLVEIDDADEEKYVHGYLSLHWRAYNPPEFWIAGNDILEENHWEWASGKPMTYFNWKRGAPDNGGNDDRNEHCAAIEQGDGWKWDDQECYEERYIICEIPVTSVIGGGNPGVIG
ncbi:C-type lectin lectoxin-Lio3-like [Argopecten irradians]|uniref:C-type lectin lectoxin-Lio3-like n=1 Tax=Argopecten irradians TaxID=31199 RepID=UPI00371E9D00